MSKLSKKISLKNFFVQDNKIPLIIAFTFVLFILCFVGFKSGFISRLFYGSSLETGFNKEVKIIEAMGTDYANGDIGSIAVNKNADWTSSHGATVTLSLDSIEIPRNTNTDLILVLDVSESMSQDRVNKLMEAVENLSIDFFANSNNRMALITFGSTSNINSNFTNDANVIKTEMESLIHKGSTNYYLALKDVETLLTSYTPKDNTDLHMIFVTDGFPTEGVGLYESQYKKLKNKYPYLKSTGIQFEMGEDITKDIKKISDYQYYAFMGNAIGNTDIVTVLYDAARSANYYSEIIYTDYIDSRYFTIDSSQSVSVPFGSVNITSNGNDQKLVWTIPADKIKSGSTVKYFIDYKIQLKSDMYDVEAYFPLSTGITISTKAEGIDNKYFSLDAINVLKSWYDVTYLLNLPLGCSIDYDFDDEYIPYEIASIKGEDLTCPNYQFKGWEVVEDDVTIINDSTFIMPSHDITIGAKWTSLGIDKSMSGTINSRTNLYQTIASQAVMDNKKSDFVTRQDGIRFTSISSDTNGKGVYTANATSSDQYPVHYFRGDVNNNYVIFGDYCWRIVRTTSTGGVKLVYNGTPTNGQCLASGADATVGESMWRDRNATTYDKSLAYQGYMYDTEYEIDSMTLGTEEWAGIVGKRIPYMTGSATYMTTPTFVGTSYQIYNSQYFQVGGTVSQGVIDDSMIGKYTIFSSSSSTSYSSEIYYIFDVDEVAKRVYVISFNINDYNEAGGQDLYTYFYNKALNTEWVYGNDVTYDSSTGLYTLQNTINLKPIEYGDNISVVNGETKYHYSCLSTSNNCSTVYYFYDDVESYMLASYITLKNGKTIDDARREMTTEAGFANSSDLKVFIENWFATNMNTQRYLNMIEDTPWCNNRNTNTDVISGWYRDGNSTENLYFDEWENMYSFDCSKNDSFTVSESIGNGKALYPVGTLTMTEVVYAGGDNNVDNASFYLNIGVDWWNMSPALQNNLYGKNGIVSSTGKNYYDYLYISHHVRPSVSLKPGVYVADGNGTQLNPYVIEMN